MKWTVIYNPHGERWELDFPPQLLYVDTETFSQWETMADVLAEAIELAIVGVEPVLSARR